MIFFSFTKNRCKLKPFDYTAFYYSVDITEDDYRDFRNQGFTVELEKFPKMVFDYLDICISEQNNENPKNFPVLEFNDIRGDEVTFEIQEINVYRRLAHLSLRLRKGNDAKVREHLGECLKQLKLEHTNALKKLQDTQTLLENSQLQYESMQVEFENQKKAFTERDLSYKVSLIFYRSW